MRFSGRARVFCESLAGTGFGLVDLEKVKSQHFRFVGPDGNPQLLSIFFAGTIRFQMPSSPARTSRRFSNYHESLR
jgi:hypothetical protein